MSSNIPVPPNDQNVTNKADDSQDTPGVKHCLAPISLSYD